ncbi:MAG: hypothetical protein Q9177_002948 [Variospora cf. flavescens]
MAPDIESLVPLSNSLATAEQIATSSSSLDGIPSDLESSIRLAGLEITQAAGILLGLPQDVVAQAMIIFTRFYLGPEGGSYRINSAKDVSAASLYLAAKLSATPQTPRSVCNVYSYLMSEPTRKAFPQSPVHNPESYYLSEGTYHSTRALLLRTETLVLRTLSFDVKVTVPHHLALTYLQTLGVLPSTPTSKSRSLAARTIGHLNLGLFSSQLLYLTHQPTTLAIAAIYLASRELGVKLPGTAWWEVFDVDREDLGFVVVAYRSCESWVNGEREKWKDRFCPLTVSEVDKELRSAGIDDGA